MQNSSYQESSWYGKRDHAFRISGGGNSECWVFCGLDWLFTEFANAACVFEWHMPPTCTENLRCFLNEAVPYDMFFLVANVKSIIWPNLNNILFVPIDWHRRICFISWNLIYFNVIVYIIMARGYFDEKISMTVNYSSALNVCQRLISGRNIVKSRITSFVFVLKVNKK